MTKILVLANNIEYLYNLRFELVDELIKQDYEVYFSVPESEENQKVQILINNGAKHIRTYLNRRGTNPFEDFRLICNYKKIINKINPDIILTYTIKPNIYGSYAANRYHKPVVMNVTGIGSSLAGTNKFKSIIERMYRYACSKAKCVFFQNKSNYNFFVSNGLVDKTKAKLIPGSGVNVGKFKPLDRLEDNLIRFLFIGRIMKEKGIEEYLRAAKNLIRKYNNVEFQILGFFEEEEYKDILFNINSERIVYLGVSSDVRHEIKQADCIVHPSYHEGMSNVLLEGGAMGKPLIASNIPGCREIVEDGYNGFLILPKCEQDLERKLIKFINLSSDERKLMGKNSRKKIVEEFDRRIVVDEYMKTICNILIKE